MKIHPRVQPGCVPEKKITNQLGKSHKTVIFHLSGEKPPLNGLKLKTCTGVDLVDMIMDVKFKFEKFKGF